MPSPRNVRLENHAFDLVTITSHNRDFRRGIFGRDCGYRPTPQYSEIPRIRAADRHDRCCADRPCFGSESMPPDALGEVEHPEFVPLRHDHDQQQHSRQRLVGVLAERASREFVEPRILPSRPDHRRGSLRRGPAGHWMIVDRRRLANIVGLWFEGRGRARRWSCLRHVAVECMSRPCRPYANADARLTRDRGFHDGEFVTELACEADSPKACPSENTSPRTPDPREGISCRCDDRGPSPGRRPGRLRPPLRIDIADLVDEGDLRGQEGVGRVFREFGGRDIRSRRRASRSDRAGGRDP